MIRSSSMSILAALAVLGVSGCSSKSSPPPQSPTQTTSGAMPSDMQNSSDQTAAQQGVTGADIFAALRAIHMAEVEHGKLALKNAQDPRVKAFADEVVNEHMAKMQRDDQLMNVLGIKPRANSISEHITSVANRQTARLSALSGADFDRAYIESQIDYYRAVLDTYDRELIPNASDPQVKKNLEEGRDGANRFLKESQDIRLSLAKQSPG